VLLPAFCRQVCPQLARRSFALDHPTQDSLFAGEIAASALPDWRPGPRGDLAGQLGAALGGRLAVAGGCTVLVLGGRPTPAWLRPSGSGLRICPLPVRWSSSEELAAAALRGVLLAHEVLDALAVERIVSSGAGWQPAAVDCFSAGNVAAGARRTPGPAHRQRLASPGPANRLGKHAAVQAVHWSCILGPSEPWLAACGGGAALRAWPVVVDYAPGAGATDAAASALHGTGMAYRPSRPAAIPGPIPPWDLHRPPSASTSLVAAASASGWQLLGQCRQGRRCWPWGWRNGLHALQHQGGGRLGELLARREALLAAGRIPCRLGDFRCLALRGESGAGSGPAPFQATPLFFWLETGLPAIKPSTHSRPCLAKWRNGDEPARRLRPNVNLLVFADATDSNGAVRRFLF